MTPRLSTSELFKVMKCYISYFFTHVVSYRSTIVSVFAYFFSLETPWFHSPKVIHLKQKCSQICLQQGNIWPKNDMHFQQKDQRVKRNIITSAVNIFGLRQNVQSGVYIPFLKTFLKRRPESLKRRERVQECFCESN